MNEPASVYTPPVDAFSRITAALLRELEPEALEDNLCLAVDPKTGRRSVVARAVDGKEAQLESWLQQIGQGLTGGTRLDVAVVGGHLPIRGALERATAGIPKDRQLFLAHVRSDGTTEVLRKATSPGPLARLTSRVEALPDANFESLRASSSERVAKTRQALGEEKRFILAMRARRPWLVWGLLGLLVLGFAIQVALPSTSWTRVRLGALVGDQVRAGEWWRLLSCTFLHDGIIHLAVNAFGLYVLGGLLERLLGASRFATIYVASGIGAGMASAFLGSDRISIGASGAIFGLLGAGAVVAFRPRGLIPASLQARAKSAVIAVLLANALLALVPRVDALAHLGGLVTGAVLMGLSGPLLGLATVRAGPSPRAPGAVRVVGGLAIATLLIAETLAIATGRPWEVSPPTALRARSVANWSIALPTWARDPIITEPEVRATELRVGRIGYDPAHVQALMIRAEADLEPSRVAAELERLDPELIQPPPEARTLGLDDPGRAGPWRFRTARYVDARGLHHQRAFGVRPDAFARVEVAHHASDADALAQLAARILTSISTSPHTN